MDRNQSAAMSQCQYERHKHFCKTGLLLKMLYPCHCHYVKNITHTHTHTHTLLHTHTKTSPFPQARGGISAQTLKSKSRPTSKKWDKTRTRPASALSRQLTSRSLCQEGLALLRTNTHTETHTYKYSTVQRF